MRCPVCGSPLEPDARFCESCGARLDAAPHGRVKPGRLALVIVLALLALALLAAAVWFFFLRGEDGPAGEAAAPESAPGESLPGLAPPAETPVLTLPPETPEPTPEPTPPVELARSYDFNPEDAARLYFSGAEASSEVFSNGRSYDAGKAIDDDHNTSWQEDAPGYGIGEHITVRFEHETRVRVLGIFPGFDQSQSAWDRNGKPSRMLVELSDGRRFEIALDKSPAYQYFEFSEPVYTEYLRFTILDAYPGSEWEDTAVTELRAWA